MNLRRYACICVLLAALPMAALWQGGMGPPGIGSPGIGLPGIGSLGIGPAMAAGLKVPRFVSLRFGTVNLRTGPGRQYPIEWVYKRRGLPVEVIRDRDAWRKVRDRWGTVGWIHVSNLTGRRTVLIEAQTVLLRNEPQDAAAAAARAEAGAIAQLRKCGGAWCRISAEGHTGWVRRTTIWGIHEKDDGR